MRKLAIYILIAFIWLSGFMTAKVFADTYTNSDIQKSLYESQRSMVAGDKVYASNMNVKFTMPKAGCFEGKLVKADGKITDINCGQEFEPRELPAPTKSVMVKPTAREACIQEASKHHLNWYRYELMEKCDEI